MLISICPYNLEADEGEAYVETRMREIGIMVDVITSNFIQHIDEEDTEPATDKQDKPKKKSTTSKSGTATTPAASTSTASTPASSDNTPASYTVAFTYNGSTFATQTVNSGAAASRPSLQPSASGNWYATGADNTLTAYDFSTPVTGNVTLVWK